MELQYIKMKAAILIAQNKPLIVDEVKLPPNLDVGQVLVKVHISGICGSQIGEISGVKGKDNYLPHLLGHEGTATVLQVGPGVKHVKPNDLVVLHWRKGIGIESNPPKYEWQGRVLNAGWVTSFNSHAIVSENRCTKIPENTDHEIGALFGCAVTTGFGVVENNAQLKIGESVVVFGSGGIGLNIIQASKLVSAWPIIAIDRIESRLKLAKDLGASHLINSDEQDAEMEIQKIIGVKSLDVFIDNTGLPQIIELGYKLTQKQGRIVLVGVPKQGSDIRIHSLPLHFGKVISGSHGGECNPTKDIPRYLNHLNTGEWHLKELITSRYSLEDINLAIEDMKQGKTAGRVIIQL